MWREIHNHTVNGLSIIANFKKISDRKHAVLQFFTLFRQPLVHITTYYFFVTFVWYERGPKCDKSKWSNGYRLRNNASCYSEVCGSNPLESIVQLFQFNIFLF